MEAKSEDFNEFYWFGRAVVESSSKKSTLLLKTLNHPSSCMFFINKALPPNDIWLENHFSLTSSPYASNTGFAAYLLRKYGKILGTSKMTRRRGCIWFLSGKDGKDQNFTEIYLDNSNSPLDWTVFRFTSEELQGFYCNRIDILYIFQVKKIATISSSQFSLRSWKSIELTQGPQWWKVAFARSSFAFLYSSVINNSHI